MVRLAGLDDYGEDFDRSHLNDMLLNRPLVGKVEDRGESTGMPSLVLFDTSSDVDVNLNQKLMELFRQVELVIV